MQEIITANREKIAELCRTHHVRRLSVFGSAVRDDFDAERSDVDLLVEFESLGELEYAPNYFSLSRSLHTALGRTSICCRSDPSRTRICVVPSSNPRLRCMPRDLKLYLADILAAGHDIQTFTRGMLFADYESSALVRPWFGRQWSGSFRSSAKR